MVKEKRILSYFLGYVIIGLFIFLIGIISVNAASYTGFDFTAQLYDNLGPSLTAVTTSGPTAGTGAYEGYIAYAANSSGGAWGISSPITLIANHTYTLTASIPNECGNIILSSYNRIGVGTTLNNAKTSYQNNTNVNEVYSKAIQGNNYLIQYAFTPTINASFIIFPFATSVTCSSSRTLLESVTIDDLGTDAVTQDEINTSLTNQTNELNTYIQESTNTITGAITDTETNITNSITDTEDSINSNIDNMEESINGTIKDNFNDCRDSYNLYNPTNTYSYNGTGMTITKISNTEYLLNGTNTSMEFRLLGGYVSVNPNNYILEAGTYVLKAWINDISVSTEVSIANGEAKVTYANKSFTINSEYTGISSLKIPIPIDTYDNATLKIMLVKSSSYSGEYEPYGEEICSNKLDEANDKLDNLTGALTDSSPTDMSGLGDSAGWLPPGPVDSILTLPLTMLNSLVTNLTNNSCQTISVELPFVKENITLPCVRSLYDKMGVTGTLFTTAGLIASAFILFNYLLALYKWVDDTLTMRENTMPGYFDDNWGGGA